MAIRVRSENQSEPKKKDPNLTRILQFTKEDGWFVYKELEIDEEILNQHSKLVYKSNPDIFPIFSGQVINKIRDIFGI